MGKLHRELLSKLGRAGEALGAAWGDFRKHPSKFTYDDLMKFVPTTERTAWHEKALNATSGADLHSLLELFAETDEMERLANLSGGITRGGETSFFSTIAHVTRYFCPEAADGDKYGTLYEVTRKNFKVLRKLGFQDNGDHKYIRHDVWAKTHPGQCNKRELIPWQIETDPLVSRLNGLAGGKLRVMENMVASVHRLADDEIVELFKQANERAIAMRAQGLYSGTSPKSVLFQVRKFLKRRSEQELRDAAKVELVET